MAYLSPINPRKRLASLGAVTALHGALAVAILTGFAGGIIKTQVDRTLQAQDYALPLDPPSSLPTMKPVDTRQTRQRDDRAFVSKPLENLSGSVPTIDIAIDTSALPFGPGPVVDRPEPITQPKAAFVPRAARPLNAPGRWVSASDYPTNALRRGEQGVTGFTLTIGPDGRVRDCAITRSSGSADLDAATCNKIAQRAQFAPASNETGDAVAGRYSNVIRWQIPE
ncbi:energy transducer TonB [Novosphingobium sp. FKTRR1]|uniref:energy transducer TonB n=1 Tax=Novosphingobium sp. FKTRR1 TaxID=2879118 RepID=UPI001CF0577A|nr:energy transducer TonB [Novosphingobium sp. FKTRR1]